MPVFNLQGTRRHRRPESDADWSTEKPLVKPYVIGARNDGVKATDVINRDISPFARLTSQLRSDERLVQEQAAGVRAGLYRLYGELGAGSCATVRLAVHQLTAERVAVKVVDRAELDHKKHEMLAEEVASMERLHHPNIIRLYEVVETPRRIHLVMEYAAGGDLQRRVTDQGPLTEATARAVVSQLVSAVQHMHSKNLVHRDIKAENVFLSGRTRVKLGDFGFSRRVGTVSQSLTQFCGSPSYACPELLGAASYRGDSADLWALGVLVFFIVTGRLPFDGRSLAELRAQILAGRYRWPAGLGSEPVRRLVGQLLTRDPRLRPSAEDAAQCRWLRGCRHPAPRDSPAGSQERAARAKLRQLGVGADTLETHRRRGLHSPVTGLYRMVLHQLCRQQEQPDGTAIKELWPTINGCGNPCTIL